MKASCNGTDSLLRPVVSARRSRTLPAVTREMPFNSTGTVAMVVAIAIVLLVVGSVLFHYLSPWYFTPIASNWDAIDDTVTITFWVTGFVFVVVNLFMAWCVLRYRHGKVQGGALRAGEQEAGMGAHPGNHGGRRRRCWPLASLPGRSSSTSRKTRRSSRSWAGNGTSAIAFRARTACSAPPMRVSSARPIRSASIRTIRTVRTTCWSRARKCICPSASRSRWTLRSIDVLHDFTVPQFRAKMNMAPGLVTYVWFTPTRAGTYDAFCEQLCGIAHYAMRGKVVVEEEAAYQTWKDSFPTFAQTSARSRRRCRGGCAALCRLRGLPRRAGRGQSRAECAETRRAGRLVPEAPVAAIQERCAGRARKGCRSAR